MPGVYAKQMYGERFDTLAASVRRCNALLDTCRYGEAVHREIPFIMVMTAERSKIVIEELCYAGGLTLLFRVLELRSTQPTIGSVRHILNYISSLLTLEIDPYDDNIGVLPLLSYFLTERHTHHVDIMWNSDELHLMQQFLRAYTSLLGALAEPEVALPHEDRLLVITTLSGVLLSFPPHRVVRAAAAVFDTPTCERLIRGLQAAPEIWETALGRRRIIQLVLAIASFGVGHIIASDLPQNQLLLTLYSQLIPELRCPCRRCEHLRRLQRAARDRNEFGIPSAVEAKCAIPAALLQGGVISLLTQILRDVQKNFLQTDRSCLFHPFCSNVKASDGTAPDDALASTATTMTPVTTTDAASPTTSGLRADETTFEESSVQNSQMYRSLRDYDHVISEVSNVNDPRIDDEVRQWTVFVIWLLSWPCDEIYHCSILTVENCAVLVALLQTLNLSDLRFWFDTSTTVFLPGVRVVIECLCTLFLRTTGKEQRQLYARLRPTIEAILERTCTCVVDACGPQWRSWRPSMGSFATIQAVMLAAVYIGSQPATSVLRSKTQMPCPLRPTCFEACVAACQALAEGYEWAGTSTNEVVFITVLLISMGILAGGFEYSRCQEHRKLLLPPPDARCAYMATSARSLVTKFKQDISQGEGCVIIRTVGSLVMARAEKAAALTVVQS